MSRTRQPMASNLFQTTTESPQDSPTAHIPTTLRLRAEEAPTDTSEATSSSRRIRWSEDVVDNEGMGKKSSKGMVLIYVFSFTPIILRNQQQSNRPQYAASTTKLDQWEKVAQKSLHPAHLRVTARVKTTVAPPESTGLATHTHTTEGGNPASTRPTPTKGVAPKTTALNRNAIAGSRVRMHMRRCLSHRKIRSRTKTMRGVLDIVFGAFPIGKAMQDKEMRRS
jgi:hypothetical protein